MVCVGVGAAWMWRRQRGKGISHVRLEENGGTVEMTNPMYLHASDDQTDDPNLVFTLHDSVREHILAILPSFLPIYIYTVYTQLFAIFQPLFWEYSNLYTV